MAGFFCLTGYIYKSNWFGANNIERGNGRKGERTKSSGLRAQSTEHRAQSVVDWETE